MLEGHLLQVFLGLVEFKARCPFSRKFTWLLRSYWAGGEKTEDLGQAELFLRLTNYPLCHQESPLCDLSSCED